MELKFIDPTVRRLKPAARVHASGKLGFNSDAATFMDLKDLPSYVVAASGSEQDNPKIFFIDSRISTDIESPPPITVARSGKYFYVNFVNILDQLKIDFRGKKVIFDIQKTEYIGFRTFALSMREQKEDSDVDGTGKRSQV